MLGTAMTFFAGWQVKLTIALVVISAAYFWHLSTVKVAVNEAVTQIETQASRESFKLKERSLNAKIELEQEFDNIQKEKNAKIQTLNARVASLTRSLQERPNRPKSSGVPDSTRTEESTGYMAADRLYRDDAAVAIWFATRTEGLKIELQTCYNNYETVKQALENFKKNNNYK